jgi:transposase
MAYPQTGPELAQRIIDLYVGGLGAVEVAAQVGVGSSTVYRVLVRHGVPVRKGFDTHSHCRKMTDVQIDEAIEAYRNGVSLKSLEAKYDVRHTAISSLFKRRGIDIRPRGNTFRVFTDEEVTEMRTLYDEGVTQTEIARRFETHVKQIGKWLRLLKGTKHHHWKGGRLTTPDGYIRVRIDADDPMACMANQGGYALEHRLVMAGYLGRPLRDEETVHHVDGDPSNNRLGNLQLRIGKHGKHSVFCCGDCGSVNIVPARLAEEVVSRA